MESCFVVEPLYALLNSVATFWLKEASRIVFVLSEQEENDRGHQPRYLTALGYTFGFRVLPVRAEGEAVPSIAWPTKKCPIELLATLRRVPDRQEREIEGREGVESWNLNPEPHEVEPWNLSNTRARTNHSISLLCFYWRRVMWSVKHSLTPFPKIYFQSLVLFQKGIYWMINFSYSS